jgi:protocatechuate 3,4-dioxygenase beta subunit
VPEKYRHLLISKFSLDLTEEGFALGYEFNIVLRGTNETPFE